MKLEIKEKWINALRSGEYEQTISVLSNNDGECCLGVLCRLAAKEGICNEYLNAQYETIFDGEKEVLPESVKEWAGLLSRNPVIPVKEYYEWDDENGEPNGEYKTSNYALSEVNDDLKWDFNKIADAIETNL